MSKELGKIEKAHAAAIAAANKKHAAELAKARAEHADALGDNAAKLVADLEAAGDDEDARRTALNAFGLGEGNARMEANAAYWRREQAAVRACTAAQKAAIARRDAALREAGLFSGDMPQL